MAQLGKHSITVGYIFIMKTVRIEFSPQQLTPDEQEVKARSHQTTPSPSP